MLSLLAARQSMPGAEWELYKPPCLYELCEFGNGGKALDLPSAVTFIYQGPCISLADTVDEHSNNYY